MVDSFEKRKEHGLKRWQKVSLRIGSLAPGGDGVSRDLGVPVFVSRVAPEDVVEVELFDVRKNFARGSVVQITEPSRQRQDPPCKIFKSCGGCQWQHISYDFQLEAKQDIVRQAVKHIGGLNPDLVQSTLAAKNNLFYRNKAQFPVKHPQDSNRILAGYYGQGTHKLVNVKHCPVQPQALDAMLEAVKAVWEEHELSAYDENSHSGLLRHILGRYSFYSQELLVTLVINANADDLAKAGFSKELSNSIQSSVDSDEEGDPIAETIKPAADSKFASSKKPDALELTPQVMDKIAQSLMQRLPGAVGVCLNLNPYRGNRILGDTTLPVAGQPYITEELKTDRDDFPELLKSGIKCRLSPASFFQINTEQAGHLLEVVADCVTELKVKPQLLVDAYAGVGTMSLWLSQFVGHVIAIEEVASAVEDGRKNLDLNAVGTVEFRLGTVEAILPELADTLLKEGKSADIVLIDPPRKGVSPQALASLIALNPSRIIYVSCNPATLARDLKIIEQNGYKTKRIQPIDMFPQTYHVETVTVIDRIAN